MKITIGPDGSARCLYTEDIDLAGLGELTITRASHVEPTGIGGWTADLSPVGGPELGPFTARSEALEAEARWLEDNRL